MPDEPTSIFISYSRIDSSFVDRLDADLKARNFRTWVDRGKLEGGQNWLDMIQQAIDGCQVLLVVLSPEAVASEYVRMEYRYARALHKLVIPLQYRSCRVPIDLNSIQWVRFEDAYGQGLKDLLLALTRTPTAGVISPKPLPIQATSYLESKFKVEDRLNLLVEPQPAPFSEPNLNELFREGIAAKVRGDLEATATLWQQVLDRDPNFRNETLSREMKEVEQKLLPVRIQRLDKQADQAHDVGAWGQEIGALQALLELQPQNIRAKRRLSVAEQNQKYGDDYQNVQKFISEGNIAAAKEQLQLLWKDAPYYGDPAELAKTVGLKLPLRYRKSSFDLILVFYLYFLLGSLGLGLICGSGFIGGYIADSKSTTSPQYTLGVLLGLLVGIVLVTGLLFILKPLLKPQKLLTFLANTRKRPPQTPQ